MLKEKARKPWTKKWWRPKKEVVIYLREGKTNLNDNSSFFCAEQRISIYF